MSALRGFLRLRTTSTQVSRLFATSPAARSQAHLPKVTASRLLVTGLDKPFQLQQHAVLQAPFCRNFSKSSAVNNVAIQAPAPDFQGTAVIDGQFKDIQLSDFKGKYLVLFFYPLDFTFVCPTEIIAYSDRASEFKAINTEVVGVSIDSHFSHLAWINTPRKQGGLGQMNIPLLSDMKKQVASDYGVLLPDAGIALRGLFLIDPEGVVRHMSVNDLPVGRSVDETLRLVKAFQFVEEHGEVCPAGWTPDSETIKPDPEGSKEYFNKVN